MSKTAKEKVSRVDYFHNEQGDFTITLYEEPIAFTKDENSAQRLVNSFKSLTLRIDTLSKMVQSNKETLEAYNRECKRVDELTEEVDKKNLRIQELEKELERKKYWDGEQEKEADTNRVMVVAAELEEQYQGKIAELEGLLKERDEYITSLHKANSKI